MAILTGPEIKKQIAAGNIRINPFREEFIGPNSVDLHLGNVLRRYTTKVRRETPIEPGLRQVSFESTKVLAIDAMCPPNLVDEARLPSGGWLLMPGTLYLGATLEYTETYGYVPYIDGRSSFGRLGVFAHVTAGRGDVGFCGNWTVEIVATQPAIIYPGGRYFQLTYHTLEGEVQNYKGRYQGDSEPVGSRITNNHFDPKPESPTMHEFMKGPKSE